MKTRYRVFMYNVAGDICAATRTPFNVCCKDFRSVRRSALFMSVVGGPETLFLSIEKALKAGIVRMDGDIYVLKNVSKSLFLKAQCLK